MPGIDQVSNPSLLKNIRFITRLDKTALLLIILKALRKLFRVRLFVRSMLRFLRGREKGASYGDAVDSFVSLMERLLDFFDQMVLAGLDLVCEVLDGLCG